MNKLSKFFIVIFLLFTITSCTLEEDEKKEDYEIIYIIDGEIREYDDYIFSNTNHFVLPKPEHSKKGYLFEGWYETADFNGNSYLTTRSLPKRDITLYLKWKVDEKTMDFSLKQYENINLERSLELPKKDNEFNLIYESSNPDILSNTGVLTRTYEETVILLTVKYQDSSTNEIIHQTSYPIKIAGYKSLANPIRSSYVYRGYETIDQPFFDSLDLVYSGFAIANENGVVMGEGKFLANAKSIIPLAKENGVWLVMSVGPSAKWSSFSSTPELRETFANNVVNIINEYGFDGVDIDWETPTTAQSDNYVALMEVVYEKVKQNNPNHLVTTAITAGPYQPPRYKLYESQQYIDYINLMAYGMISNNGMYQNSLYDTTDFHNKDLEVGKTLAGVSIDKTIPLLNSYGVPNNKIIVGLAFYGISQLKSGNQWNNNGSIAYHYILENLNKGLYTEYYDEVAQVPYALSKDKTIFISYDNPRSITVKGNYVITNGLGGLMYWEHYHDNTRKLLDALSDVLMKGK